MLSPTEHEREARALADEIYADTGMALYAALAVARAQIEDLDRFALAWDAMVEHQRAELHPVDDYAVATDRSIPTNKLTSQQRYLRRKEYE